MVFSQVIPNPCWIREHIRPRFYQFDDVVHVRFDLGLRQARTIIDKAEAVVNA